jgi:hypothetical protein
LENTNFPPESIVEVSGEFSEQKEKNERLTFDPEAVNFGFDACRLEADTEGREQQDTHEQHYACIALDEASQLEQLLLRH